MPRLFASNKTGLKFTNSSDVSVSGGSITGGTYGIISDGSTTTVDGVNFNNIFPSYVTGIAVTGLGGSVVGGYGAGSHAVGNLTVKNSTFSNIGRVGVLVKGDQSSLTVNNITYTGKGAVNGLDYAVEFGAGGTGSVLNSTITSNRAVASSDGSTSAGILVTNYYGNGTSAAITGNDFSNNTAAIAAGYSSVDNSSVVAHQNNISGNDYGVTTSSAVLDVNVSENWWGHASGPSGDGTGSGDSVGPDASFSPWLCGPAPSTLTTTDGVCNLNPEITIVAPAVSDIVSTNANGNKLNITGSFTDDVKANYLSLVMYGPGCSPYCSGIVYGFGLVFNPVATYADASGNFDYNMPVPANLTDGTYTLYYTGTDFQGGVTSGSRTFAVDNTAPSTPSITAPGARQWLKGASTANGWTAATDTSGIKQYEVKYEFVARPTAYRLVNGTSRTQSFTGSYQGPITISVRAQDNAGNWGMFSAPVTYNYDSVSPSTDINVSTVVAGVFTVSGDAADNLGLNRVYVQLVSREINARCGGTTINLIPNGAAASWSKTYNIQTLMSVSASPVNCPDGNYAAHVTVVDMAGNTSSAGWTSDFVVDGTAPAVAVDSLTTSSSNPTITGTVDDTLAEVEVTINAESHQATNNADGTWSITWPTNLSPASYTVTADATDEGGNTSTSNGNLTIEAVFTFVQGASTTNNPTPKKQSGGNSNNSVSDNFGEAEKSTDTTKLTSVKDATTTNSTEDSTSLTTTAAIKESTGSMWKWWALGISAPLLLGLSWWIFAGRRSDEKY